MTINIEDYKEMIILTESELDILYLYLDMEYHSMKDEERAMWAEILDKIDPDDEI